MPVLVLGIIGLVGLVAGLVSLVALHRSSGAGIPMPANWARRRIGALALGLALATLSAVLSWTAVLGYPLTGPHGTGRIVGIPFFVAYFDPEGYDYVGALSMISTLGNAIFWLLVPQIALAMQARRWRRRHGNAAQASASLPTVS